MMTSVIDETASPTFAPAVANDATCVEINQCVGCTAMTRPSWLGRAARNRHRHAIEQASRRWRACRRDDSARTRRKSLISTQDATCARAYAEPVETAAQSSTTTVEWPSENQRPTKAAGRLACARSTPVTPEAFPLLLASCEAALRWDMFHAESAPRRACGPRCRWRRCGRSRRLCGSTASAPTPSTRGQRNGRVFMRRRFDAVP